MSVCHPKLLFLYKTGDFYEKNTIAPASCHIGSAPIAIIPVMVMIKENTIFGDMSHLKEKLKEQAVTEFPLI